MEFCINFSVNWEMSEMCISASGLLGRHGLATEFPQQQVCVIYTPQTNRKVEFWQPSLRKNYISFPILVETFGQRLEYFPSSISSAAGDQRSPGHSALSSLAENWHDCILNLHCRMEEASGRSWPGAQEELSRKSLRGFRGRIS